MSFYNTIVYIVYPFFTRRHLQFKGGGGGGVVEEAGGWRWPKIAPRGFRTTPNRGCTKGGKDAPCELIILE